MTHATSNHPLVRALIDAKIIPQNCKEFSLHITALGAVTATSTCLVTSEQLDELKAAIEKPPEAFAEIIHNIAFLDPRTDIAVAGSLQ